ncbi:MAG: hypothetical protein JXM70_30085 [Pirellulales bacterium]|nr:hypothetical protein [Pirellulales bacterium]
MLTEQEISRSWRKLFKDSVCDETVMAKAEALIDELRPESPLRHRLSDELEELKKIHAQKCG